MVFNTQTGEGHMVGGGSGARPRGVFYPPRRTSRSRTPPSDRRSSGSRPRGRSPTEGLVVDNVGKSFRGRPVVKGVSLRLSRGEVAGLLGPNGAGKTTCFYMITGLIPADYGAIYLDGENITAHRCTSAPAWASATCRRRPRSSAA
jgi:ABC-type glutathione transport system ATPase component